MVITKYLHRKVIWVKWGDICKSLETVPGDVYKSLEIVHSGVTETHGTPCPLHSLVD